jgi:hypothetical protein
MLDLFGILFSSLLILFVVVRAVQLDRMLPWFQSIKRRDAENPDAAKGRVTQPNQSGNWRRQA